MEEVVNQTPVNPENPPVKPEKKRHSGIDLLRIIALFLICFSHANQTFASVSEFTPYGFASLLSIGLTPFGTFGNVLFVICSSYFLVDKTRSRAEKAINILMDSSLISLCILIGFLISPEPLSVDTIIQQIFPDVFALNWFVPCYAIFYLLSPIAVIGLKHFTKKQHFVFTIASLLVYGGLSLLGLPPIGSNLLQFFYILNLVAFVKWHVPSLATHKLANFLMFLIGLSLCYAGIYLSLLFSGPSALTGRIPIFSPFLVIAFLGLFNLFEQMRFENKFISYLSGCSLFVYVIHENFLLRTITRVNYYYWAYATFGNDIAVAYMLVCGLFMFVAGFLLAVVYKETLARLTTLGAKGTAIGINKLFDKIYALCFKE